MRLCNPRFRPFRLKLEHPVLSARGSVRVRQGFLVEIGDGSGRIGTGEATPYPAAGTESLGACRRALEAMLEALPGHPLPTSPAGVDRLLEAQRGAHRTPAARCGVELALLDLVGQRRRLPVARLLRPGARLRIPVSILLVQRDPADLAREARRFTRRGFRVFKLKIGAGTLALDRARVAAVRKAAGPRARLRLDANGAFRDLATALSALSGFQRFRIELCEEPLAHPNPRALRQLRAASPIPIAADESLSGRAPASAIVRRGAVDLLVLKPMVQGGLIPSLELARRARRAGIPSLVTTTLDGIVARLGAAHLAAALPHSAPASGLTLGGRAREQPVDPSRLLRGWLHLPSRAGLGLAGRAGR